MTSLLDSSAPNSARKRLDFAYDYQGRRVSKIVSTWNGTAYANPVTNNYVYDGWNLLGELNGTNGLVRGYTWGLDLSGTLDQAGGIGGLLVLTDEGINHFVAYDGNGNVTALVKEDGSVSAQYEYSPFGQEIRSTGAMAKANPFHWSTKFWDGETGLSYYGRRYYSGEDAKWIARDPIGENGGRNLYAIVANNTVNLWDPLGKSKNLNEEVGADGLAAGMGSESAAGASRAYTWLTVKIAQIRIMQVRYAAYVAGVVKGTISEEDAVIGITEEQQILQEGAKAAPRVSGAYRQLIGEAKSALKKNEEFRTWMHRAYKNPVKGGSLRKNPDLTDDMLVDAWTEFCDRFGG
jgi:RHS repeat-associated protein